MLVFWYCVPLSVDYLAAECVLSSFSNTSGEGLYLEGLY